MITTTSQSPGKVWMLLGGALSILVGFFAITAPALFSYVITAFIGALCLGSGLIGFFQALDDLAAAVKNSDHTNMQRGVAELDTLQQGVTNATAKVGSDMNVVDMQNTILDAITLNLKTIKSNAEDLDYTSAITKMNKDQLSLEAAQSSFAKISQLSLFKYMN